MRERRGHATIETTEVSVSYFENKLATRGKSRLLGLVCGRLAQPPGMPSLAASMSPGSSSRGKDADRELFHLRETLSSAASSWQEAEAARQVAHRESTSAKLALQQVEEPSSPVSDTSDHEEWRRRKQPGAIQSQRDDKTQFEKLQAEVTRASRKAAAAEVEAKMRHMHLEKVEAQQQAAVARAEAQDAMQTAQRIRAASANAEDNRRSFMAEPASNEKVTFMSALEMHQQLRTCQAQLTEQKNLASSLQYKLRKTEGALRESHAAEQRARSDCNRHASKRKDESEAHSRAQHKLEKQTLAAEDKAARLEADNAALKEEVDSIRNALLQAEIMTQMIEDNSWKGSKGELRRLHLELDEERRRRHETERDFALLKKADDKAHSKEMRKAVERHEVTKVALTHARHMRDSAEEKIQEERDRADAAKHETLRSQRTVDRLAAEKAGLEARHVHSNAERSSKTAVRQSSPRANRDVRSRPGSRLFERAQPPTKSLNATGRTRNGNEGLFDRTSASSDSQRRTSNRTVALEVKTLKDQLAKSLAQVGDLFRTWDRDGSGRVDKAEFRRTVEALGIVASEDACDTIFDEFDVDRSGTIDYSEYALNMLRDALQRSAWPAHHVFQSLDTNDCGTISRAEFQSGLRVVGFNASFEDMDAIFDEVDINRSGRLEYRELQARLRRGQSGTARQ